MARMMQSTCSMTSCLPLPSTLTHHCPSLPLPRPITCHPSLIVMRASPLTLLLPPFFLRASTLSATMWRMRCMMMGVSEPPGRDWAITSARCWIGICRKSDRVL